MKKSLRFLTATLSLILFLLFVVAIWFMFIWHVRPITDLTKPMTFVVSPGISTVKLTENLYQNKIINNQEYFIWLAVVKREMTQIKAGEYQIDPGMTVGELLERLVKGDSILRKITLIEGWTFQEWINTLNENQHIAHTLQGKTPEEIMVLLGHKGEPPEGRFYPDTYFFTRGTHDTKMLKMAYDRMQKKLAIAWASRAADLPYHTLQEALIIASMVEKEAKIGQERPYIAGVILKRLEIGMRLQIDATVIYGRDKNYSNPLTRADLRTDTPYNTYTRDGLPPAPISMPSLSSIEAALHPIITNDIYYVAKGDGTHIFSQDLEGHQQAIGEYKAALNFKRMINSSVWMQSISPMLMQRYWQSTIPP